MQRMKVEMENGMKPESEGKKIKSCENLMEFYNNIKTHDKSVSNDSTPCCSVKISMDGNSFDACIMVSRSILYIDCKDKSWLNIGKSTFTSEDYDFDLTNDGNDNALFFKVGDKTICIKG